MVSQVSDSFPYCPNLSQSIFRIKGQLWTAEETDRRLWEMTAICGISPQHQFHWWSLLIEVASCAGDLLAVSMPGSAKCCAGAAGLIMNHITYFIILQFTISDLILYTDFNQFHGICTRTKLNQESKPALLVSSHW